MFLLGVAVGALVVLVGAVAYGLYLVFGVGE